MDRKALLEELCLTAREAGAEIWAIFEAGFETIIKADASPVTVADHAAEAIILKALARLAPDIPVVAEEEAAAGRVPTVGARFFLVDPLDGTRDFVARGRDFTVNIGLIEDGTPTLGVIYAPSYGRLWAGDTQGGLAFVSDAAPGGPEGARTPLTVRPTPPSPVAVASKSHDVPATEAYLKALGITERRSNGSSLKFCLLAEGKADIYPRPSPTSEWDT
ncbi:MAG: 3'(2'),5'-bisphosphate nucleotidase CysQ, partial [Asticcacaulis sp.]|nr:3'(2'),5'-bisphosphate nucleotidase CysQ [Asticcacaulis sp.]